MERPQSPDHVCLGSRGLGSLQTALLNAVGLGSVGEHVVKNVRVPVTVVPLSTPVPENITVRTGVSEHGL
jgi:nucleotide-binding universal stress UspA family protein